MSKMDEEHRKLIRRLMWIAFVWNDHNFEHTPQHYAREELEKIGVTNFDEAYDYLDKLAEDDNGTSNSGPE